MLENEIKTLSNQLGLKTIINYKECIDTQKSFEENLCQLLRYELIEKEQRGIERRTSMAGFQIIKNLETFEHGLLPHLKKEEVDELATFDFAKNKDNIVMIGNSGTGKTHLLISLGVEAIKKKYTVKFFRIPELISMLKEAETNNALTSLTKKITNIGILLLDELGYMNIDEKGVNLLFSIIASRCETKSTIITTNFDFPKWIDFLGENEAATALVDRMVYKTIVLNMKGPSYRLAKSKSAQKKRSKGKNEPKKTTS